MKIHRSRQVAAIAAVWGVAACSSPPTTDGGDANGGDVTDVATDSGTDVADVATDTPGDAMPLTARTGPTNGGAIAISGDDHVAVAVNRFADSVSVFTLSLGGTTPTVTRTAQISTGAGSRPWAVVIGNDNDTAYVVLRGAREVVRIRGLSSAPTLDTVTAATGSEPTGLAITPTGATLFVANWEEGTVTAVATSDLHVGGTVDLNASLAGTGSLGPSVPTAGRPALAHPRALVITNNGDTSDADETVYVTEFFSQARTSGVPTDDSQFDVGRQGLVYRFNVGTMTAAAPIPLAPIANTGFNDSNGVAAGCFPNQLYGVALNHNRLYVSSVCASPRGPIGPVVTGTTTNTANFKTQVFALVSVVDTAANAEVPTQAVVMTQQWQSAYDTAGTPDDATRRMPLIVNDLAFVPSSSVMYASAYGSDAVFRVAFAADGTVGTIGSSVNKFIELDAGATVGNGQLPFGLAINNAGTHALTINGSSRNVSLIQLSTQTVVATTASADALTAAQDIAVNDGRRFFVTGLARWSLHGQGWNSCESCHNDGLTDNVTWYFARGPRQTTSLDATYAPDGTTQRLLNWTAINDEVHDFELNTRGNSGGVGAVVHASSAPPVAGDRINIDGTAPVAPQVATQDLQNGLNGSVSELVPPGTGVPQAGGGTAVSTRDDWTRIDGYLRTIVAPHAPTNLTASDVTAGHALFVTNNCNGCHGGSDWTLSRRFYTPGQTVNNVAALSGSLRGTNYTLPTAFPHALNPVAMLGSASLRHALATDAAANDQINCILRAVGTYPATGTVGVTPTGVALHEVRQDMTTPAQGATGYNPPSLLGMATGAPYFHGGNARSLEEVFAATFAAHYTALSTNFLSTGDVPTQTRQLVAYLLSIDESTPSESVMGSLPYDPDLCPTSFP